MEKTNQLWTAHFRIGWEPSPDYNKMLRYHAVSVDYDRIRTEIKMHQFMKELSKLGPINPIRQPRKGKISGTNLEYMFQTFDSEINPNEINFSQLGKRVIKDGKFCERLVGKIEDYVERIYNTD
jgi:hypothetical protein